MIRFLSGLLGVRSEARNARRHRRFAAKREAVAFAPFPLSLYRQVLERAVRKGRINFCPFIEAATEEPMSDWRKAFGRPAKLYLRHDVDTADCVDRAPRLLEVNVELATPAAVSIRTDGLDYDPSRCRPWAERFRAAGLEIGLHTTCYLHDDFLAAFRRETVAFADTFGFRPMTFTVHGLGERRMEVRQAFVAAIKERLSEFGFTFTDCHPTFRHYDHVIQDCHRHSSAPQRAISADFVSLPDALARNRRYLLLTHPGYWR